MFIQLCISELIIADLIFEGFATPTTALALDPEQTTRSEDGSLEPAGLSATIELTTGYLEGIASLVNSESNRAPLVIEKPDPPRTLALNS